jgi:hypothetical protein
MYRNQIAPLFEIPLLIEGFCTPRPTTFWRTDRTSPAKRSLHNRKSLAGRPCQQMPFNSILSNLPKSVPTSQSQESWGKPMPPRVPTCQTERDHAKLMQRKTLCAGMFDDMEQRLKAYTKREICQAAKKFARETGAASPDRICARHREALICFFCGNFPHFPEGFPPITRLPQPGRASVDSADDADRTGPDWYESTDLGPADPDFGAYTWG